MVDHRLSVSPIFLSVLVGSFFSQSFHLHYTTSKDSGKYAYQISKFIWAFPIVW